MNACARHRAWGRSVPLMTGCALRVVVAAWLFGAGTMPAPIRGGDVSADPRSWRWTIDLSAVANFAYDDDPFPLPLLLYDAREAPPPGEAARDADAREAALLVETVHPDESAAAPAPRRRVLAARAERVAPYSRGRPVRVPLAFSRETLERHVGGPGGRVIDLRVSLVPPAPEGAEAPPAPYAETRLRLWRIGGPPPAWRGPSPSPGELAEALDDVRATAGGFAFSGGRWTWLTPRRREAAGRRWLPWRIARQAWRNAGRFDLANRPLDLVNDFHSRWPPALESAFGPATYTLGRAMPAFDRVGGGPAADAMDAWPIHRLTLIAVRFAAWRPESTRDALVFPGIEDIRRATPLDEYAAALRAICGAMDRGGSGLDRGELFLATPPPYEAEPERGQAYREAVLRAARERAWTPCDLDGAYAGLAVDPSAPAPARLDDARARLIAVSLASAMRPAWGRMALAALPFAAFALALTAIAGLRLRARWRRPNSPLKNDLAAR